MSRILTHVLLFLLIARMPAAPLAPSGVREGHPVGEGLSLSRCAWPVQNARKAAVRLIALVRDSSFGAECQAFRVLASDTPPRDFETRGTSSLDAYGRRALGRPLC